MIGKGLKTLEKRCMGTIRPLTNTMANSIGCGEDGIARRPIQENLALLMHR
ncbi:hypothetical protein EV13_2868 [Prochlorococcus sp. MIT 0702]|nr:hypothetical protein EV13_2868 [Prochlorococcus sp. MIT 0702]